VCEDLNGIITILLEFGVRQDKPGLSYR